MPEFSVATTVNFVPEINTGAKLPMVFLANTLIDDQLPNNSYPEAIAPQLAFFKNLATVEVQHLTTKDQFFALLQDSQAPPLICILTAMRSASWLVSRAVSIAQSLN